MASDNALFYSTLRTIKCKSEWYEAVDLVRKTTVLQPLLLHDW